MMQQNPTGAKVFVLGSFVAACSVKVDELPQAGESLIASAFTLEAGGKGLNLAVACCRLGAVVDGVFVIGDDWLSGLAELAMRQGGLSTDLLIRRPGPTGAGVGFIAASGENCLAVHPGANLMLSAADMRARAPAIRAADMTLAHFETADGPIAEAFALARSAGRRTLLNPSPFRPIAADILAATSILCVNGVEAAALARMLGEPAPWSTVDALAALGAAARARGVEALVVTHGAGGVTAVLGDAVVIRQPAFAIDVVDTLGAGDAFAAGLATALAVGLAWPEALRRGAACGALVAARLGVFDALPFRADVDRMIARSLTI